MLEMTDCKYFRYNEIKKVFRNNIKLKQIINCQIGMGGKDGCPKYGLL